MPVFQPVMQSGRLYLPILITAVAYFIAGRAGIVFALPPGFASPIWPASGIALALTLLWGYRCAYGVWLGSFMANVLEAVLQTQGGALSAVMIAGGIGLGASAQALAGAWMVRKLIAIPTTLEHPRDVALLITSGGIFASLINATIGNVILWSAGVFFTDGFAFRWFTWWMGDVLGVLIFAPAVLLFLNYDGTISRSRKLTAGAALLLIFLVAAYVYQSIRKYDDTTDQLAFNKTAEKIAGDVKAAMDENLEVLASIQGFIETTSDMNFSQFERFTRHYFTNDQRIRSFAWLKKVNAKEQAAFERAMQSDGFTGYKVRPWNRDLAFHDLRLPVKYMVPEKDYRMLAGLDPYTEPLRHDVINASILSAEPRVLVPVSLLQDPSYHGMLIFAPVYYNDTGEATEHMASLRGMIGGVVVIPHMLRPILEDMRSHHMHLVLTLADGEGAPEVLLDSRTADLKKHSAEPFIHPGARRFIQVFDFAGKQFNVEVMEDNAFAAAQRHWSLWIVLVGEALCAGLMCAFVLMITGRSDSVQRLVSEKTQALAESQHRLQSVIENTAEGLVVTDQEGNIRLFNRACERVFGYSAMRLIGSNINMLFTPDTVVSFQSEGIATGKIREGWGVRADNTRFPLEMTIGHVVQAGTEPLFISVIRDITDRRNAETTRERLIAQLTAVNEELEQFAYVASHDLREPLRMVVNFTHVLEEDYGSKLDEQGREYMAIACSAARKMELMIADLLEYARLGYDGQPLTGVDCNQMLERVRENLSEAIEASGAQIHVKLLPMIEANPVRFVRLLQNLIGNAIKYQSPGNMPVIKLSAEDKGSHWLFSVADNGIGISSEYWETIFMPFRRLHTEQQYPGSGIGLAICKRIVESFGGTIWIYSVQGTGSTFYFTVPKQL